MLNLTGKKFGGLIALRHIGHNKHNIALWECRCTFCGRKIEKTASNLRRSNTQSCGCVQRPNLKGRVFGRLTVLRKAAREHNTMWECRCTCKTKVVVSTVNLQSGNTKSCGCSRRVAHTHGETVRKETTPEYRTWRSMMARCYNENTKSYPNYGGRGIKVHRAWWKSTKYLIDLVASIGRRPSLYHSIDRIDNDGNYCPGNIRWATKSQQTRNQRKRPRRLVNG
jgi:hypothetical protein